DRLQQARGLDTQELCNTGDTGQVGRVHVRHRRRVDGRDFRVVPGVVASRSFDVRRVVAVRAPHEVVFTDRGNGHELAAPRATHLARLRLDRAERQPAPLEYPAVGVVHRAVALLETVEIGVER